AIGAGEKQNGTADATKEEISQLAPLHARGCDKSFSKYSKYIGSQQNVPAQNFDLIWIFPIFFHNRSSPDLLL
ncbi:MAG: hypothetical protein ACE5IY_05455, partial [bacterium]